MEDRVEETSKFRLVGNLEGHRDWITCIVTGHPLKENEESPVLVTGSRDKTLMVWKLTGNAEEIGEDDGHRLYGVPLKSLTGHNHFVSDISLSADNSFALSSSWDKTIRLWDLRAGKTSKIFVGHTKEIHSVCFSQDNRQIISAGADKAFKLWNTLAECKLTNEANNHSDWVSCVRYSPVAKNPFFATAGWDGRLKVWHSNFLIKYSFKAHEEHINSLSIAPLANYIATAGKESQFKIWDLSDLSEENRAFSTGAPINQIAFNPVHQWIAAACENGVQVFDLNSESEDPIAKLVVERPKKAKATSSKPEIYPCTALAWSSNGSKLFAAFTDNIIRVYDVNADE